MNETFKNNTDEKYRVEYDDRAATWYAYSIDCPFHITQRYSSLAEALHAADMGLWLPLDNLVENLR